MTTVQRLLVAAAAFPALAGCLHLSPTDPSPVQPPLTVSVTLEYTQPFACENVAARCGDGVNFSASWMAAGGGVQMTPDVTNHTWRGTAVNVPVDYPPRANAYQVRVFDPYLAQTPSQGFTAQRLVVGGEFVVDLQRTGTPGEYGLIYVDANGVGHSPYQ